MSSDHPLFPPVRDNRKAQRIAWLVLNIVLIVLALWVIREFIGPVVWAAVITIALWPLLLRISGPQHDPRRATGIALLLTIVVGLFVVVPVVLVFAQTVGEVHELAAWFKDAVANGIPVPAFLPKLPFGAQIVEWWSANLARPLIGSPAMEQLHGTATVVTVGRHVGFLALRGIVHLGFMLLVLFVLLRTGPRLADQSVRAVRRLFGMAGARLAVRMAAAVRGTVTGLVVVGFGEGALIGVAYGLAGLPHVAALSLLTAIAAMLPFCAPIVFGAAAWWLFSHGSATGAFAVLVTGAVVVFVAEHFVRPVIIGNTARLPFLLVLFGILGGAQTFGLVGLFIGPALMTALAVVWRDSAQ